MAILKVRPVNLAKRAIRKRRLYIRKRMMEMSGGPLKRSYMESSGTLEFSLGEFRGYYDQMNTWISTQKEAN